MSAECGTFWRLIAIAPDAIALLADFADALRGTGYRDADGLCWCAESVEVTGNPHQPKCVTAREVLARLDALCGDER